MKCCLIPGTMLLLLGCTHTDSFVNSPPVVGPHSAGNDVQLTFNIEQDYWPTWTQDGHGILYSFVAPGTGSTPLCRASSGSRRHTDLGIVRQPGDTGRFCQQLFGLRARERWPFAVRRRGVGQHCWRAYPSANTLWLADTAAPFQRTALLSLPIILAGVSYSWLSDIAWTGPASFIALVQDFSISEEPQPPCDFVQDSIFMRGGAVVAGTITAGHADLQLISGTTGATGYSLAEDGTSVVFTTWNDPHLFKVPVSGGPVTPLSRSWVDRGRRSWGYRVKDRPAWSRVMQLR